MLLIVLVLCSSLVIADELKITDIDALAGTKTINNIHENHNQLQAKPGEEIILMIELTNEFPSKSDIDIEQVDLEIGVDFDDNFYYQFNKFDIDSGDDLIKTISIKVPENAEGNYLIKIDSDGIDSDGNRLRDSEYIDLTVINPTFYATSMQKITGASTEINKAQVIFAPNEQKKTNLWLPIALILVLLILLLLVFILIKPQQKEKNIKTMQYDTW